MWYTVFKDEAYEFELLRGLLGDSPMVENTVGPFLLSGLADMDVLNRILNQVGIPDAAKYFAAHVANKDSVRIGDFGEVIAGHLLEEEEGLERPIEKLRFRESPTWPMKLTDVFCIRVEDGRISTFVFGEAKAGTTPPPTLLGKNAYQQIYRDIQDEEPQILFFTLDRLHSAKNNEAYLQLEEAMHRSTPVPRALRLVFVFDNECWKEDLLESLDEQFSTGELVLSDDFKCYVLTREGLKEVITDAYGEADRIVANG